MQENIAALLQTQPEFISIKATTHEKTGPVGREESMAVSDQVKKALRPISPTTKPSLDANSHIARSYSRPVPQTKTC